MLKNVVEYNFVKIVLKKVQKDFFLFCRQLTVDLFKA